MNKKGKGDFNYAGAIVIAAILIIIGSSLITSNVAPDVGKMRVKVSVLNESLNYSAARAAGSGTINTTRWFNLANGCPQTIGNWRLSDTSDCALSGITIRFNNGTALVANTDYIINTTAGINQAACDNFKNGDLHFLNSSNVFAQINQTVVDYTYCNDGYIPTSNAGARAMTNLIIVFFALLIMAIPLMVIFRNQLLEMVGLR